MNSYVFHVLFFLILLRAQAFLKLLQKTILLIFFLRQRTITPFSLSVTENILGFSGDCMGCRYYVCSSRGGRKGCRELGSRGRCIQWQVQPQGREAQQSLYCSNGDSRQLHQLQSVSAKTGGPKWHWPWASVVVERAAGVLGGEGCWGFPVPLSPVGGSQPRGDFSDLCQPG